MQRSVTRIRRAVASRVPTAAPGYADFVIETLIELSEVDWFDEEVTCDDHLADFSAEFHDVRGAERFIRCLVPDSYLDSQDFEHQLLNASSLRILYPSVRHRHETCATCFQPALVMNLCKGPTYRFVWKGRAEPEILWVA
jgi:hypothetical protein